MSWSLDYILDAEDFNTGETCRIARLVENMRGDVVLAMDQGDGWYPTWVGPKGPHSVHLPGRWSMSPELLALLPEAS